MKIKTREQIPMQEIIDRMVPKKNLLLVNMMVQNKLY